MSNIIEVLEIEDTTTVEETVEIVETQDAQSLVEEDDDGLGVLLVSEPIVETIEIETTIAILTEETVVQTIELDRVGPQGPPGTGRIKGRAAITLSGHRAVVFDDTGELIYADNATLAHLERSVFLTVGAIIAGEEDMVLSFGELTEPSWSWTPGQAIYLGAAGLLTQTPPSLPSALFQLEVASALTATRILFAPKEPAVLG